MGLRKMSDDKERVQRLTQTVRDLAQQIDWLVPFLDKKAKESGDVAGLQVNARQTADSARKLLHFYEAADEIAAKNMAISDGERDR